MPSFLTPPRDNQTRDGNTNEPLDLVYMLREEFEEIKGRFVTVLEALHPDESAENIETVEIYLSRMSEELLQVERFIFGLPGSEDEDFS